MPVNESRVSLVPFYFTPQSQGLPLLFFSFPIMLIALASQPKSELWAPWVPGDLTQQEHDPEQSVKCWVHALWAHVFLDALVQLARGRHFMSL